MDLNISKKDICKGNILFQITQLYNQTVKLYTDYSVTIDVHHTLKKALFILKQNHTKNK